MRYNTEPAALFCVIFTGGRDAAINALQKKLAEVDSQRKKELEMRENIEAELKSLQDTVCIFWLRHFHEQGFDVWNL